MDPEPPYDDALQQLRHVRGQSHRPVRCDVIRRALLRSLQKRYDQLALERGRTYAAAVRVAHHDEQQVELHLAQVLQVADSDAVGSGCRARVQLADLVKQFTPRDLALFRQVRGVRWRHWHLDVLLQNPDPVLRVLHVLDVAGVYAGALRLVPLRFTVHLLAQVGLDEDDVLPYFVDVRPRRVDRPGSAVVPLQFVECLLVHLFHPFHAGSDFRSYVVTAWEVQEGRSLLLVLSRALTFVQ